MPAEIQLAVRDKRISMGHARAILGVEDPEMQMMIFDQMIKYDFSVRKVEEVVRELVNPKQEEEIEKKAMQTGNKPSTTDAEASDEELSGDEMLPAAVDVILETGQASVSMLQRRLKLGYARAARIVDEMEEKGIVGPFQGSKPRTILVTKEQWELMRSGNAADQMDFDDLAEEYDDFRDDLA